MTCAGDGFIDRGEYVTIQTLFGNSEADSNKAFDKLSEVSQPMQSTSRSVNRPVNPFTYKHNIKAYQWGAYT